MLNTIMLAGSRLFFREMWPDLLHVLMIAAAHCTQIAASKRQQLVGQLCRRH
jgi:hypothetical protein